MANQRRLPDSQAQRMADSLERMAESRDAEAVRLASEQHVHLHSHQPAQTVIYVQTPAPRVQTIEKTSKRLKAQILMANFVCLAGIVTMGIGFWHANQVAGSDPNGSWQVIVLGLAVLGIGIIWSMLVRSAIWWNHG